MSKWKQVLNQYQSLEFDELNTLNGIGDNVDDVNTALINATNKAYQEGWYGVYFMLEYPTNEVAPPLDYDIGNTQTTLQNAKDMGRGFSTIFTTEIHKAYTQGAADAADEIGKTKTLYKQWDATLDEKTRDTHILLDGEIKRNDEYFETVNGKALAPSQFGVGEEDCNCRCILRYFTYDE